MLNFNNKVFFDFNYVQQPHIVYYTYAKVKNNKLNCS